MGWVRFSSRDQVGRYHFLDAFLCQLSDCPMSGPSEAEDAQGQPTCAPTCESRVSGRTRRLFVLYLMHDSLHKCTEKQFGFLSVVPPSTLPTPSPTSALELPAFRFAFSSGAPTFSPSSSPRNSTNTPATRVFQRRTQLTIKPNEWDSQKKTEKSRPL